MVVNDAGGNEPGMAQADELTTLKPNYFLL